MLFLLVGFMMVGYPLSAIRFPEVMFLPSSRELPLVLIKLTRRPVGASCTRVALQASAPVAGSIAGARIAMGFAPRLRA